MASSLKKGILILLVLMTFAPAMIGASVKTDAQTKGYHETLYTSVIDNMNDTEYNLVIRPYQITIGGSGSSPTDTLNIIKDALGYNLKVFTPGAQGKNLKLSTLYSGNILLMSGTTGKVGIRNSNPSYTLDVAGSVRASDDLVVGNDIFIDSGGVITGAGNVIIKLGNGNSNPPTSPEVD